LAGIASLSKAYGIGAMHQAEHGYQSVLSQLVAAVAGRGWVVAPVRTAGLTPPKLEIVHSPYRKFLDPLLEFVERQKRDFPTRQIAVIVPEVVKRRWWQYLLHQYRAERLAGRPPPPRRQAHGADQRAVVFR
jgi:hypothetical protein